MLASTTLWAQKGIDTIRIHQGDLQMQWLRAGKNEYLVYMEDTAGQKSRLSLWERHVAFDHIDGQDVIRITQTWYADDSLGRRKLTSLVSRTNFAPLYHHTWHPPAGVQAFQFGANSITGVDSVAASTNKTFSLPLTTPTLNWELDLETFATLPLAEGKRFAINFYHPGGRTAPQYYLYTVTGSQALRLMNGQPVDCWKLEIAYDATGQNRGVFYISKQTHDVLKMEEVFGNRKRYKVKLGVS